MAEFRGHVDMDLAANITPARGESMRSALGEEAVGFRLDHQIEEAEAMARPLRIRWSIRRVLQFRISSAASGRTRCA